MPLKMPLQVWNSPHSIRIAGSKFAVDTVSQGALQWQVRPFYVDSSS